MYKLIYYKLVYQKFIDMVISDAIRFIFVNLDSTFQYVIMEVSRLCNYRDNFIPS